MSNKSHVKIDFKNKTFIGSAKKVYHQLINEMTTDEAEQQLRFLIEVSKEIERRQAEGARQ